MFEFGDYVEWVGILGTLEMKEGLVIRKSKIQLGYIVLEKSYWTYSSAMYNIIPEEALKLKERLSPEELLTHPSITIRKWAFRQYKEVSHV